jgi:selenocysteine lyase/cysteine desulfurase
VLQNVIHNINLQIFNKARNKMKLKTAIRVAVAAAGLAVLNSAHTEPTLAPVVVTATADYAGDYASASSMPSYQISMTLGRAIMQHRQLMAKAASASDVRCVPTLTPAAKATTSQSDSTDRWLAAN